MILIDALLSILNVVAAVLMFAVAAVLCLAGLGAVLLLLFWVPEFIGGLL